MPPLILPPSRPELVVQQRWISVKNISGEDIPAFAAMERVGVDGSGRWHVRKPTRDDHPSAYLNGGARIPKDGNGIGTRDFPTWAMYGPDDGTPSNGESLGTRDGFWELYRGYEGFLVWGGADGEKVYVQSDLTCRENGTGYGYDYYLYENPCCGLPLPRTICANHIGSTSHDGGVELHYWNASGYLPSAPKFNYESVDHLGGINPPPWIPDIRLQYPYDAFNYFPWYPNTVNRFEDFWNILFDCYRGKQVGIASPGDAAPSTVNLMPTWWSNLIHDFDCAEQSVVYQNGFSGANYTENTFTNADEYYSFYVFMNQDFPRSGSVAPFLSRCSVFVVQMRKKTWSLSSQPFVSGVPTGSPTFSSGEEWQVMGGQVAGHISHQPTDPDDDAAPCAAIRNCDPFSLSGRLTAIPIPAKPATLTTFPFHKPIDTGNYPYYNDSGYPATSDVPMRIASTCYTLGKILVNPSLSNEMPFEFYDTIEADSTCTENQDCELEWQIIGYPIIGYVDDDPEQPIYDYENPIYGWVEVCVGNGTYTASGPRIDLFICANGDPYLDEGSYWDGDWAGDWGGYW